jgi:SPRY domain
MDYPGKIITKNATAPTQASASGVWTVDDALIALRSNTWPIAGVLNPISKSLRFNSADSAYLNRTPTSASNRKTWTWSAWIKRSALSANTVFAAGDGSAGNRAAIDFDSDQFRVIFGDGTSLIGTTQVFRDPSAWYHFVVAVDTTQATASNRVKLYVNGSEITALSSTSYPAQNYDTFVNATNLHTLGARYRTSVDGYFSGYMTEVNFIDGQALTPSSFGATDAQTGQWIPKKYTGTYGTNGFYVNFSDSASTGALGTDYSGNGNNWTPNNFSVTAGAGNDSLTDVPTPWIAYSTNSEVGGVVRGNYCTLNPLNNNTAVISNGNLDTGNPSAIANWLPTAATMGVSSGKWYWEVAMTGTQYIVVGIFPSSYTVSSGTFPGDSSTSGYGYYSSNGYKYVLGTGSSYGASYTTGDTIGVALDLDAGTLVFYKNNVSQGTAATGISGTFVPGIAIYNNNAASTVATCNFGQRPFAYTPPTGYKSLCATNLPTPTIGATTTTQANDYFNVVLYTGTGATRSITGVGFQPDFVWIKNRSIVINHGVYDAVRGALKDLQPNVTDAEVNYSGSLTSFDSDGFSLGSANDPNKSSDAYVAWNWKANGSGSTNTAGSITSTVSANTTAGFSIVTWTGNGTAGATIGHGLGVAPAMIIAKRRNAADNWPVYHSALGATYWLRLNSTIAAVNTDAMWNNTAPTSTVFTVKSDTENNASGGTYVAYCFAEVAGYSKFGSYTGSGGTAFIYTGFRPAYVLIRRTNIAAGWGIIDSVRNSYNSANRYLNANASDAEGVGTAGSQYVDLLSNGFRCLDSSAGFNASGDTYIFAAFAESPFKFANAR